MDNHRRHRDDAFLVRRVRGRQRVKDLTRNADRRAEGQRAVPGDQVLERVPLDIFHDEVGETVIGPCAERAHDIFVRQR